MYIYSFFFVFFFGIGQTKWSRGGQQRTARACTTSTSSRLLGSGYPLVIYARLRAWQRLLACGPRPAAFCSCRISLNLQLDFEPKAKATADSRPWSHWAFFNLAMRGAGSWLYQPSRQTASQPHGGSSSRSWHWFPDCLAIAKYI